MTLAITQEPVGPGESAEQAVHNAWDTADRAMINVLKMGFQEVERPKLHPPRIDPQVLANASPQQYSMYYGIHVAWLNYTDWCLAQNKVYQKQCENEMEDLGANIRHGIREAAKADQVKKPNEDAINDMVAVHPRYRELRLMLQQVLQEGEYLEKQRVGLSRWVSALSRNLEIRKEEIEHLGGGTLQQGRRF